MYPKKSLVKFFRFPMNYLPVSFLSLNMAVTVLGCVANLYCFFLLFDLFAFLLLVLIFTVLFILVRQCVFSF